MAPRWSNHVQYYTAQCPMGDNYENNCPNPLGSGDDDCPMEDGSWWGLSATQVKALSLRKVSKFFLGKFTADFKSQEKSIMIGSDPRYMQYTGDGWICSGVTDGTPCPTTASLNALRAGSGLTARIQRTGSLVTIHAGSDARSTIRISDSRGRTVRTWSGLGSFTLNEHDFTAGTYLLSVNTGARAETIRLPLASR